MPSMPGGNNPSLMRTVLFLCTGNYYRSRFAEELFNARAAKARLDWRAESRALAIERGKHNVGPISPLVRSALAELGLVAPGADRLPASCTPLDFESADLIVALSDAEHRPLMLERYADWHARTEFWNVEDIGVTPSPVALAAVQERIEALIGRLTSDTRARLTT
jgi:low molecular weight protein-tyrosine phosphatase